MVKKTISDRTKRLLELRKNPDVSFSEIAQAMECEDSPELLRALVNMSESVDGLQSIRECVDEIRLQAYRIESAL